MRQPWRSTISLYGVGLALGLGLLGQFITFFPGTQVGYYAVASIAATAGLLAPGRRTRAAATLLALGLAWLSWDGYLQGQRYRETMRHRSGRGEL